ncbi:hypothetical protein ACN28S_52515 [Cystobacter fuscus]
MATLSSPTTPSSSLPTAAPLAEGSRALLVFCLFALYVIWGSTYLAVHWALQGACRPS